jgi:hypothetical protein
VIVLAKSAIDWSALGKEVAVAAGGGIGIVAAFGLVLTGVAQLGREHRDAAGSRLGGALRIAVGAAVCLAALVVGFVAMTHKS